MSGLLLVWAGHHDSHYGSTPRGSVLSTAYHGSRIGLMKIIAKAVLLSLDALLVIGLSPRKNNNYLDSPY